MHHVRHTESELIEHYGISPYASQIECASCFRKFDEGDLTDGNCANCVALGISEAAAELSESISPSRVSPVSDMGDATGRAA